MQPQKKTAWLGLGIVGWVILSTQLRSEIHCGFGHFTTLWGVRWQIGRHVMLIQQESSTD